MTGLYPKDLCRRLPGVGTGFPEYRKRANLSLLRGEAARHLFYSENSNEKETDP